MMLVIGAHNTLIADTVNGFSIAFLKLKAHFHKACRRGHAMKFGVSVRLRRVNDPQRPPFRFLDVFNRQTFGDSHWAVAFRTVLDSRLT